jgi:hypothetical protein
MSYDRSRPPRRPLYAPPPPHHRQHSVLGYWVPLIVTGTIAIGGLATWIWSERNEHDEDDYGPDQKPQRPPGGVGAGAPYPPQGGQYPGPPPSYGQGGPAYQGPVPSQSGGPQGGPPPGPPPPGVEAASYYGEGQSREHHEESQTFYGQVRGALRRTPSPQQFFDHASKQVSAGIAAAGSALGSIMEDPESGHAYRDEREHEREEDRREGFSDHERWSEEADEKEKVRRVGLVESESERRAEAARSVREDKGKGKAKRTVAVVVSADTNMDGKMDEEDVVYSEHAVRLPSNSGFPFR